METVTYSTLRPGVHFDRFQMRPCSTITHNHNEVYDGELNVGCYISALYFITVSDFMATRSLGYVVCVLIQQRCQ